MRTVLTAVVGAALVSGCATLTPLPSPAPTPAPAPVVVQPPRGPTAIRARIDSILSDTLFRSAIIGVLVVDAVSRDTLYARNPYTALMPASNMKIITGATALARLGAGYRYRTTFALRGAVRDGTLDGDLLVFGRGDPSVSQRMRGDPLAVLSVVADSLRARGVRRISGALVHAGNAFTGSIYGFGWEHAYLDEEYAAGVDELMLNEGRAFDPANPIGSDTLSTPVAQEPALAYMQALRAALAARGIEVAAGLARDSTAAESTGDISFDLQSPPLPEILGAMMKPSQNQIAEIVSRTLALDATGAGDRERATQIVTEQLQAWGADTMQFNIHDGSGLSRHNLLSPATIVTVLLAMRAHTDFPVFYAALPAVGSEGTVRTWLRGTRAAEVVRGKTGTLDMVRAFSGYATTPEGRPLVLSFVSNHHRTPTARVTAAIQQMLRALTEISLSP